MTRIAVLVAFLMCAGCRTDVFLGRDDAGGCDPLGCGPRPAIDVMCSDGMTYPAMCLPDTAGVCRWQYHVCPPATPCTDSECGARPGVHFLCADGSTGGVTDICSRDTTGACHWEFRECPDAGLTGAVDAGQDAGPFITVCGPTACGPAPTQPVISCGDGTTGGPTGRCIQTSTGACEWEIRDCPDAG